MEVPGAPVSSKSGETSVKWQLCYDMTAKMWWMVSGEVPTSTEGGLRQPTWGPEGTAGSKGALRCGDPGAGVSGVIGSSRDPALSIWKWGPWAEVGKPRADNGEKAMPESRT